MMATVQLTASFENREVVALTGVSERALRYWADRQVVTPDLADAVGRPGIRRRYSFPNLVECGIVLELLRYGINISEARDVLRFVRNMLYFKHWPRQCFLVVQGGQAVGLFVAEAPRGHMAEVTARFPKVRKTLPRRAKLGVFLERLLRDANEGDSLLIVAVHSITERMAQATGLPIPRRP
jgi:DNA-binding transcriptional MerR regulator